MLSQCLVEMLVFYFLLLNNFTCLKCIYSKIQVRNAAYYKKIINKLKTISPIGGYIMIQFQNVEKRMHDMIIIPSFQLTMKATEVQVIYSNVNIRDLIIELLCLKSYHYLDKILLTF